MKKTLLVSSILSLAGAAVAIYLWRRLRSADSEETQIGEPRKHHLTKVFSRAKAHQTLN